MRAPRALDLFAGARGWDVAARRLGWNVDGVEIWDQANLTAGANYFHTIHEDVTTFHVDGSPYRLGIASPSCKKYSMAGKGDGRRALEHVLDGVRLYAEGKVEEFGQARERIGDADAALTLEPLRIFLACRPTFIALEQTPAVLPVWNAYADVFRDRGYSVVTAVVNAEQYGVPQTRRRAVLLARRDGEQMVMPAPTHSRYWNRDPKRLDVGVKPWVSMAEALGWDDEFAFRQNAMRNATVPNGGVPAPTITGAKDWRERVRVVSNYGTGGDPANRGERLGSEPFAAVTSKADRFKVQFRNNNQDNACVRLEDEPSGTIFTGYRANWMGWERADDGTFIRKVTSEEAATLQTFPADHRFLGTKSQVMTQIGNAVPPLLAEALLAQFPLESQG